MSTINPHKQKITAWSYSRYSKWVECPRKIYYNVIEKIKEPGSAAMDRGSVMHKDLEKYINGDDPKAKDPPSFVHAKLVPDYRALREEGYICESELAFTAKWSLTGWFGNAAWCRIKTDAISEDCSIIIDHKSGKVRDNYGDQLSLYALGADLISEVKHPVITTALLFVDHGERVVEKFDRKDLDGLKVKWEKKVKPMMEDVTFTPNPGNACRWCHYSKSKGGPCEF